MALKASDTSIRGLDAILTKTMNDEKKNIVFFWTGLRGFVSFPRSIHSKKNRNG